MNSVAGSAKTMNHITVEVIQEHHIARAQHTARMVARSVGLSQAATYCLATAVSELAGNLVFHATDGGDITIAEVRENGRIGVEVVAVDAGPGMADVELCLQEGFSTNHGLGGGLPGVKRLMDEVAITSSPGAGTRIVARKWESCK